MVATSGTSGHLAALSASSVPLPDNDGAGPWDTPNSVSSNDGTFAQAYASYPSPGLNLGTTPSDILRVLFDFPEVPPLAVINGMEINFRGSDLHMADYASMRHLRWSWRGGQGGSDCGHGTQNQSTFLNGFEQHGWHSPEFLMGVICYPASRISPGLSFPTDTWPLPEQYSRGRRNNYFGEWRGYHINDPSFALDCVAGWFPDTVPDVNDPGAHNLQVEFVSAWISWSTADRTARYSRFRSARDPNIR